MKLLFGQNEDVGQIVGDALGVIFHGPYEAIGFLDNAGYVRGGAIFNNYNGSNIEVTVYAPNMATRGMIRAVMHYVFVQLKCNRLTAKTRRSNKTAQKMLPRMGFSFETTLKQWYGADRKDDAVQYVLTRDDALGKWLNVSPRLSGLNVGNAGKMDTVQAGD